MKLPERITLFFGHLLNSLPTHSENYVAVEWFKGYELGVQHGRGEAGVARDRNGRFAKLPKTSKAMRPTQKNLISP